MRLILILFSLFIFSFTAKSQNVPVWEDSTTLINSINIIINDDSLSNNLKLNLIYKFLEKNKPLDIDSFGYNQLTNAPDDRPSLLNSKDYLQPNDRKNKNETVEKNQCQAITRKGVRCSRNTKAGSKYCWQHDK